MKNKPKQIKQQKLNTKKKNFIEKNIKNTSNELNSDTSKDLLDNQSQNIESASFFPSAAKTSNSKKKYQSKLKVKGTKKTKKKNNFLIKILSSLILIFLILLILDKIFIKNNKTIKTNKTNITEQIFWKENNYSFYIASSIVNIQPIADNFFSEMKKLVHQLGPRNVYVSIVENNNSKDNTTEYLREFDSYLQSINVSHKFYYEYVVKKPRRYKRTDHLFDPERITFYSQIRNLAMDYLYEIPNLNFNKTLIINFNDIVFKSDDVIRLIETNEGNYDVACALDFIEYNYFYDRWTAFDNNGSSLNEPFPYFEVEREKDAIRNGDPARVFSCWNGLNVFNAKPFKDRKIKFRYTSYQERSRKRTRRKMPASIDMHYECECTLINIDLFTLGYKNKLVNPNVRVAYNKTVYEQVKFINDTKRNETKSKEYLKKLNNENITITPFLEKWYLENKIEIQ